MLSPSGSLLATLWQTTFNDILFQSYGQALDTLLQPLLHTEGSIHHLPILVAHAFQQPPERLEPLKAAWSCIYRAAKLFDDIQDGDTSLHLAHEINQGLGLLWVAHRLLADENNNWLPQQRLAVLDRLHPCLLRATAGQQIDVEVAQSDKPFTTPEEWVTIAAAKSGELLEWVTWSSTRILTDQSDSAAALGEFGKQLGILLQVVDDFEGVWGPTAKDLSQPALNLTFCYGMTVAPADVQKALWDTLQQAWHGNTRAQAVLRAQLEQLGGREFLWTVAQHHARIAQNAIATVQGIDPTPLHQLLKKVFPLLH